METTQTIAVPGEPETPHIEVTPDVCRGSPRIAGTRIRVQDVVVWHERLHWSADEICTRHPQVTLADVYAALAYYHDHRTQIDQQMEAGRTLADSLREATASKLPGKMPSGQ